MMRREVLHGDGQGMLCSPRQCVRAIKKYFFHILLCVYKHFDFSMGFTNRFDLAPTKIFFLILLSVYKHCDFFNRFHQSIRSGSNQA